MQLKAFLPSLLLLAPVLAEDVKAKAPEVPKVDAVSFVRASSLGVTKRDPFSLLMQPHYMALPMAMGNDVGGLAKRQSCPPNYNTCYDGCCTLDTVCGIYGGEVGCCPKGKTCSGVGGCGKNEVTCPGYCCVSGSTCTTDATGEPSCGKPGTDGDDTDTDTDTDTGNNGCDVGYSPCTIFQGCCPTGSECVLPKNCDIPCQPDDPPCGNGCCPKGSICTDDLTCRQDVGGDFTDIVPTTTTTRIRFTTTLIEEPETTEIETTSTTEETSTETTETSTRDVFPDDVDEETTTTTATTTTRNVPRVTVTKDDTGAAPTMGPLIGGGLGVAAGLIGALVL